MSKKNVMLYWKNVTIKSMQLHLVILFLVLVKLKLKLLNFFCHCRFKLIVNLLNPKYIVYQSFSHSRLFGPILLFNRDKTTIKVHIDINRMMIEENTPNRNDKSKFCI